MSPPSGSERHVACYVAGGASLGLALLGAVGVLYGLVRVSGDCFASGFPSQGFFVTLFAGAIASGLGAVALALYLRARMDGRSSSSAPLACPGGAEMAGILGVIVGGLTLLPAVPLLLIVLLSWPLCVD